jgi:hypothetical protein
MTGGLRTKSRLRPSEEVNPLDGAINIVDAMLVFACGLMLALIINWNIDLNQAKEKVDLRQGQEVTRKINTRTDLIKSEGEGALYEKVGTVYKDPATGKLFMLTD